MATSWIELPYQYDEKDLKQWFTIHNLTHLKKHGDWNVKVGDAIRNKSGLIARVMDKKRNEVGEPHILIANKNLSSGQMSLFIHPSFKPIEAYVEDTKGKCPQCGSFEGGGYDCPECGYGSNLY